MAQLACFVFYRVAAWRKTPDHRGTIGWRLSVVVRHGPVTIQAIQIQLSLLQFLKMNFMGNFY